MELLRAQAVCLCSLFLCVRLCRAASFRMRASRGCFCERLAARNGSSCEAAIVCARRIKFFQKRKILREKSVVKIFSIWYNKPTVAAIAASIMSDGGIAQLVRALASHARGRRFESYCPYQKPCTVFAVHGIFLPAKRRRRRVYILPVWRKSCQICRMRARFFIYT